MSYEAPRHIGLIEKAAQLALKHGIVYNAQWREFRGEPSAVEKATTELKKWSDAEGTRQFRAGREW